jgi:hypothetical protein
MAQDPNAREIIRNTKRKKGKLTLTYSRHARCSRRRDCLPFLTSSKQGRAGLGEAREGSQALAEGWFLWPGMECVWVGEISGSGEEMDIGRQKINDVMKERTNVCSYINRRCSVDAVLIFCLCY